MAAPRDFCGYEMMRRLGSGGMAVVWEARKKAIQKRVALKILRSEYAEDEDFAKRFEREAKNSAKMEHPNIVQVVDYGRCDGVPFIEMEYVEGRDLSRLIKDLGRALPIEVALLILREVCGALAHAHAPGREVVHRDIKPSNVMFTSDGIVKLMDFGLARARSDDLSLTTTGLVMGTVPYMAPEQAAGQEMTIRSDIFSTGVMAFELLSGARPFQGDSPSSITRAIQEYDPPRLDRLNPLIPDCVGTCVEQMLEKLAERRCPSIEHFERVLDEGIEKLGIVRERKILRDFAQDPAAATEVLRRRGVQRHLDQGLYFEKVGAGKVEDALLEFRRVLALDPENATARSHFEALRESSDLSSVGSGATTAARPRSPNEGIVQSGSRRRTAILSLALVVAIGILGVFSAPNLRLLILRLWNRPQRTPAEERRADPAPSTPRVDTIPKPPAAKTDPVLPDSGNVSIVLSPAAMVVVDDGMTLRGVTDLLLRLPVGLHHVRATASGYDSREWAPRVTKGGARLQWDFAAHAASLTVSSSSDCWAWIRIDGRDTQQHTPAKFLVSSGSHDVEIYKDRLAIPNHVRHLRVRPEQALTVEFDVPCPP